MRSKKAIPSRGGQEAQGSTLKITVLEQFTGRDLEKWRTLSEDLDELQQVLYFHLQPERQRRDEALLASLSGYDPTIVDLDGWCRLVDYQFTLSPLSAAGSLRRIGGRFNAGIDLDRNTLQPWPALYLAEDSETAYREYFQIPSGSDQGGLTPQEMALFPKVSYTFVRLQGRLLNLFDTRQPQIFNNLVKVLATIPLPQKARELARKLKLGSGDLAMIRTVSALRRAIFQTNWRVLPMQFGLPSQSQIIGDLIRRAGFEGVIYSSSKGKGSCIALFPEQLHADSNVRVNTPTMPVGAIVELNLDTVDFLTGWDTLPASVRERGRGR